MPDGTTSVSGPTAALGDRESLDLQLGVDAHRRESPTLGGASNELLSRARLAW